MVPFDPDAGRSNEEVLKRIWSDMDPKVQVYYTTISEEKGIPVWEVLMEAINWFMDELANNPDARREYFDKVDHTAHPLGHDPLLVKLEKDDRGR